MAKTKPKKAKQNNFEKTQWQRWLEIDQKISSGFYPSAKSIAEEYEISIRTIFRDIDFLKTSMNAPIEYDAYKKGYFYTDKKFKLSLIQMTEKEFFALMIAEKALGTYKNTPFYNRLADMFERINLVLSATIPIKTSWLSDRYTFLEMPNSQINENIWDTLVQGMDSQKEVLIDYEKVSHETSSRLIRPYHILNNAGQIYAVAYCTKAKDLRTFALSRIHKAKLSDISFEPSKNFNITDFVATRFGDEPADDDYNVKLEFSSKVAPLINERIWYKGQSISKGKSGSAILQFNARSLLEIERWVLSWGKHCRVLAPEELILKVKDELDSAKEFYQ